MTPEERDALRAQFEGLVSSGLDAASADIAWAKLASLTSDSAGRLCESLRLILEPTLAAKLGGEYRSGKRINMRRVIPYIASNFRKDKIWMRRTTPSKRTYQVLLAVDDSRSMAPGNSGAGTLACEAIALMSKALSKLEVGDIGIASFGELLRVVHPLGESFSDASGAKALSQFTFSQDTTRTSVALQSIVGMLDDARSMAKPSSSSLMSKGACMQIVFLISDGMLGSGGERDAIRRWITEATQKGQLVVLVIVDKAGKAADSSILNMQSIKFVGGRVVKNSYLDDYPFPYYLVLNDTRALPDVLADALRQWFDIVARSRE